MLKSQGKGKGKIYDDIATLKYTNDSKEDESLKGALKENIFVRAIMKSGDREDWEIARIVKARRIKGTEDIEKPDTKQHYEYYVHFEGEDRRLDRWVKGEEWKLDEVNIQVELEKRKQQEEQKEKEIGWQHDVHQGLDEK